ncbi:MAG: VCBS repeat-containing protein [Planctomycetota bacterium]|nr:VCBS repeat-containing protein [Planctomycetota bacterium]
MPRSFIFLVALLSVLSYVHGETVVLTPAPEPQTGLKAIIEKWKADELARQGGKFGDHGWWPWGLEAFDYDNDGDLDLIAQHHGAPRSMVLRNELIEKGTLSFVNANAELGLPAQALSGCFRPQVWDIDGDGFLDLAYCDAMPNTVWFNKGGKSFEPMGYGIGQLDHVMPYRDLNGDGIPDAMSHRTKSKYLFDPAARTFKREPYEEPLYERTPEAIAGLLAELKQDPKNRFLKLSYLEHGDLNGDGIEDLVACGFGSYGGASFGRFLLGDKSGNFSDATDALGLPKDGTPVQLSDVNADGRDDVLIVGLGLYVSDPAGRFALKPGPLTEFLKARGPYAHKVYATDLNDDGRTDFAISNARSKTEVVYESLGGGEFREVVRSGGWDADPVVICDIDNDGAEDVCFGGPGETVTLLLNRTAKRGHGVSIRLRMDKPNPFALGAVLEIYKAGELGKPGARPIRRADAPANGLPIHAGLGEAAAFDLRATFPGQTPKTVELKGVEAKPRLTLTPDGKLEEAK